MRRAALLDVAKAKASAAGLVSSEGGAAAAQTRMAIVHDFFDPKDPMLDELAGVLRPVLPVDDFLKKIGRK